MTSKEYLLQYKQLASRVAMLQTEIEQLRTDAESMAISLDGMPHGSSVSDKTARLAVELAEHESKLTEELSKMWHKRMRIVNTLGQLSNSEYQMLLYMRYIQKDEQTGRIGLTWETIAVNLGYTWRHTIRLHGYALAELDLIRKSATLQAK